MTCQCGCGFDAGVAKRTRRERGVVVGQPNRFIIGHASRKGEVRGYRSVTRDSKHVGVHRIRAEMALGKELPPGAVVHHADGSRSEHAPLVICQDDAYHRLLHQRMRVVRAGGNPNTERFCGWCQTCRPVEAFAVRTARPSGRASVCKACVAARNKARLAG